MNVDLSGGGRGGDFIIILIGVHALSLGFHHHGELSLISHPVSILSYEQPMSSVETSIECYEFPYVCGSIGFLSSWISLHLDFSNLFRFS